MSDWSDGTTTYTYDDGSTMTVDASGTPISNTPATDRGAADYAASPNFWDKFAGAVGLSGKQLAGAVGGLAGLLGANTASSQRVGYTGGIPRYQATREALPIDYTNYVPGQGHKYFTDVDYKLLGQLTTPTTPTTPVATATPIVTPAPTPEPTTDANITAAGVGYAAGGLASLKHGRYLPGATDGMADEVPANIDGHQEARLSHGEFVLPADIVSHIGNGNSEAGAKRLYDMMDKIRKARTGTAKQGKQINPSKYLPA